MNLDDFASCIAAMLDQADRSMPSKDAGWKLVQLEQRGTCVRLEVLARADGSRFEIWLRRI